MKKVLAVLLALLFCISFVGCEELPSSLEKIKLESKDKNCVNEIDEYNNKFYRLSVYNPDFEVTDYKDGLCINRYLGNEEYVEIPEEIGGKPVLKLGLFKYQREGGYSGSTYEQYFSTPFINAKLYDKLSIYLYGDEYELTGTYEDYCYRNVDEKWVLYYGFHEGISLVKKIKIPKTIECISNINDYTVTFEVDKSNPYFSSVNGNLCSKDGKQIYRKNYYE